MGGTCCKKGEEKKTVAEADTQTEKNDEEGNLVQSDNENKENNEKNETKLMPYQIHLENYLDPTIDDTDVFDREWYNDMEKDKIIYSKRSIIAMQKKAFDENNNSDYKEIYSKHPLFISVKSSGSFINSNFQITKNLYIADKSLFPKNTSLKMIAKYMLNVKERTSWDQQLKSYKVIEGNEEGQEIKCILHNWLKSPMFLVSERDIVEKRYDFYYNGSYYNYESSVNDKFLPPEEGVTRIFDIISLQEIHDEGDNFVFRTITQMDAKVSLPQSLINTTLSGKLKNFYEGIIKAMNNDYEKGQLVFVDNDGNEISKTNEE